YRANHTWIETNCVVLSTRLAESMHSGGTHYRPQVTIRYKVGEQTHQATTYGILDGSSNLRSLEQAKLDKFVVGQQYPCWYDPADPNSVILVRGYSLPSYVLLGLGSLFLLLLPLVIYRYLRQHGQASQADQEKSLQQA